MNVESTSVAVIGLGYWGPNRVRALNEIIGADVAWICDSDVERLQRQSRATRAPGRAPRSPTSSPTRVDAVVIATPVFTHHGWPRAACEAGKHVFVEKPLAASSGEANDLIELAERRERVLMCGHTFLYSPPCARSRALLDDGDLGDLHFISSSRVNLGPYRSDVSVVFDLGPHDFSILRYWLGAPPSSVSAVGRDVITDGVSDVAFVNLTYPDGLLAHVELSWLAPSKLRRTVIVGSEKMLVYEDGTAEPCASSTAASSTAIPRPSASTSSPTALATSSRCGSTPKEPIVAELEDFVSPPCRGDDPVSGLEVAIDVIRIVEAAEARSTTRA